MNTSTMNLTPAPELVALVGDYLATGPFGENRFLLANSEVFYTGAARLVAELTGASIDAFPQQSKPFLESQRQAYIDEALAELSRDHDLAAAKTRDLEDLLSKYATDETLDVPSDASSCGLTPFRAWAEHPLGRAIIARFGASMGTVGHDTQYVAVDATEAMVRDVRKATGLLERTLPSLVPAVFEHVGGLCLFEGNLDSGFSGATPLLIFTNVNSLSYTLDAADLILHESLHQKMRDIDTSFDTLADDYVDNAGYMVHVPWGGAEDGRVFSVDRAMSAYHVYTHLALLHIAAISDPESGPEAALLERLLIRWGRADHFGTALLDARAQRDLGVDGRKMVDWLRVAVDELGRFEISPGVRLADAGASRVE
ncbi:hypothetical protein [Cutibacterium avidum]|uniref:hypothetical protein n=1 Tax=Cutibacterium avidum TaxID=33010 RepID=UPI001C33F890|nr:hypothetical protein [Cutibacterium avidum]BCQ03089.1 hypothetical protein TPCV4_15330 [Cutibacterium avidum]